MNTVATYTTPKPFSSFGIWNLEFEILGFGIMNEMSMITENTNRNDYSSIMRIPFDK